MGIATVPVAAIGVPPMASSRGIGEPNGALLAGVIRSGRRDADQCGRDARDPQNQLNRSG